MGWTHLKVHNRRLNLVIGSFWPFGLTSVISTFLLPRSRGLKKTLFKNTLILFSLTVTKSLEVFFGCSGFEPLREYHSILTLKFLFIYLFTFKFYILLCYHEVS